RRPTPDNGCQAPLASTISAMTQRMTTVRIRVAKSELMSCTPTLPKMAGRAANTAGIAPQNCQGGNKAFMSCPGGNPVSEGPDRFGVESVVQFQQVTFARNLDGAEAGQVRGDELGVEQDEAAPFQAFHQMHQGHLAGIAAAREHAFAEKGGAQPHAVQAA